jgi:hypothetical protein
MKIYSLDLAHVLSANRRPPSDQVEAGFAGTCAPGIQQPKIEVSQRTRFRVNENPKKALPSRDVVVRHRAQQRALHLYYEEDPGLAVVN